jgi:hypothetical protein
MPVIAKLVVVACEVVAFIPVKFWSVVEPVARMFEKVCNALKVFACARLSDATTAPLVGEIVSVPSELDTVATLLPPPLPHADPVEERVPFASACTQVVAPVPSDETTRLVVEAVVEYKFVAVSALDEAVPSVV